MDSSSRIVFVNRAVEELTGLKRERLKGKKLSVLEKRGLISESALKSILDLFNSEHEVFEIEFTDHRGDRHFLEIHSTRIETTSEKNLLQIIGHDITRPVWRLRGRREELIGERSKAESNGFCCLGCPVFRIINSTSAQKCHNKELR